MYSKVTKYTEYTRCYYSLNFIFFLNGVNFCVFGQLSFVFSLKCTCDAVLHSFQRKKENSVSAFVGLVIFIKDNGWRYSLTVLSVRGDVKH